MKKYLLLILLVVSGCAQVFAEQYDDERMYNLASQLKDLAQELDGYVKFSDDQQVSRESLLQRSGSLNIVSNPFSGYQVLVDLQGNHVVLMLCDKDISLMEDAGCNAEFDKIYWKRPQSDSCKITLQAAQVCS